MFHTSSIPTGGTSRRAWNFVIRIAHNPCGDPLTEAKTYPVSPSSGPGSAPKVVATYSLYSGNVAAQT